MSGKIINYSKLYSFLSQGYTLFSYGLPFGYALPPMHIYFLISDSCNLNCDMCTWIKGGRSAGRKNLSLTEEDISDIFSRLPRGVLLTLSGGEPFMRKDLLLILGKWAKKFRYHLITNGTLLNKKNVEQIVSLGMNNFFSTGIMMLGISIHGDKIIEEELSGVPGTYEKIIKGVQLITEEKKKNSRVYPLIHFTTVINSKNVHLLSNLYSISTSLGINYHNFVLQANADKIHSFDHMDGSGLFEKPADQLGMDIKILKEEIKNLKKMSETSSTGLRFSPENITGKEIIRYYENKTNLNEYKCAGLWSKMIISPAGDVFMCYKNLGNLKKLRLTDIWNGEPFRKLRKEIKDKGMQPGCLGCCYRVYRR